MLRTTLLAIALSTAVVAPAFADGTSSAAPTTSRVRRDAPPSSGDKAPASRMVVLKAIATIDAGGRVSALEWRKYTGLEALVVRDLDKTVRAWEFVPGTVDGVPMETRTELHVIVKAEAMPDGSAALTVASAKTGPGGSLDLVPRPPIEALSARDDAVVAIRYAVDTAGRATITTLDVQATGNKRAFERSIRDAVKKWRFVPETVGGRPQAATGQLQYRYCTETCTIELPADWTAEDKVDSKLALKDDVRGQRI
jgi:TonB family protein